MPTSSPGIIPPRNRYPIDVLESIAYTTIGMLGGIIGPMVALAAVMAQV